MIAHSGVYPVIVADEGGQVIGFASLSPYRPRPGYATAVEDSIYVAAQHRGKGVGRMLLSQAVELARTHGFHSVVARVSATQQVSVALHQACGFDLIGVEREIGRKFGRWVDVTLLQRLLEAPRAKCGPSGPPAGLVANLGPARDRRLSPAGARTSRRPRSC